MCCSCLHSAAASVVMMMFYVMTSSSVVNRNQTENKTQTNKTHKRANERTHARTRRSERACHRVREARHRHRKRNMRRWTTLRVVLVVLLLTRAKFECVVGVGRKRVGGGFNDSMPMSQRSQLQRSVGQPHRSRWMNARFRLPVFSFFWGALFFRLVLVLACE